MYVKTDASQTRYSLLKFNLSSITGTVTNAKLRVYGSASATTTLTASQTTDSWAEAAVTWANKPPIGTAVGSVVMNTTAAYYEIDVTAYVLAQAAGDAVVSFVLSESAGKYTTLNTSENSSNKPELIVTN